jgi:DNA helicase-2/ATP-dependent DNA helicase PcrA
MGYNTSMRFKGEVRWLEPEEQALYREAEECLIGRYLHYSREVKRLRKSWMAIDHLIASSIQQARWDNPPDGEPFFGRIDISFDGEVVESRYIGYSGIDVADTRILDWRTPLAEVYYSGASVGEVSYKAPRGVLQVRLTLRRRFKSVAYIISTEHESLPFYGDVQQDAEQLFADYLEEMLARYTDGLMRDIVRTIDEEQNEAIRTDKPCIVVVGRPGTGKTSVALHRIAYLNYKRQQESRGGRRTSHFAYISPTVRLCAYTSGVFRNIPDTFPEYWSVDSLMTEIIKAHHRHFSSRRLPSIQAGITIGIGCQDYTQAESALPDIQQLHSSPLIGELVYLLKFSAFLQIKTIVQTTGRERLEKFAGVVERINNRLRYVRNELTLREGEPHVNPCIKAAEASIDRLSSILRFCETILSITSEEHNTTVDLSGVEASSLLCQGRLFHEFEKAFNALRKKSPFWWEVNREFVSYDDQLRDYIPSLQKILETLNPVQLFRKVWSDPQVRKFVQHKFGEDALSYLQALAERPINEVFHDEKPLLCLFMHSVFKMDHTPLDKYAAIAIDEVQNLPYSLLLCIRRMAPQGCDIILMADPDQRTSLLGSDTAQVARLFETTEYRLTRVYRSNPHILNAARALLNTQEPIVLVRREGLKPELYESPDENLAKLAKHLLDTKSYTNVAIITKCLEDAKALGQRVNLPVVSEDKAEILRGAFIIPLSLCAGLEFDAVIVWNAADEQYAPDSEADKRKLYVASTRAMHQLIFHKYPKTPSKLVDALIGRQLVVPASL